MRNFPFLAFRGVPWGSVGFRGVPRLPVVPVLPLSIPMEGGNGESEIRETGKVDLGRRSNFFSAWELRPPVGAARPGNIRPPI